LQKLEKVEEQLSNISLKKRKLLETQMKDVSAINQAKHFYDENMHILSS